MMMMMTKMMMMIAMVLINSSNAWMINIHFRITNNNIVSEVERNLSLDPARTDWFV